MRTGWKLLGLALVLIVASACGQGSQQAAKDTGGGATAAKAANPGVDATVDDAFIAEVVANVNVPDDAQEGTTIGEGTLVVDTADSEGDVDAVWTDQVNLFGDDSPSETAMLWDDENSVLYLYGTRMFDCLEGDDTAEQDELAAIYGEGNALGVPAGSGWYAVYLGAGQCAAATDMLWGCRFDPTGNRIGCGTAEIDDDTGQLMITGVQFAD